MQTETKIYWLVMAACVVFIIAISYIVALIFIKEKKEMKAMGKAPDKKFLLKEKFWRTVLNSIVEFFMVTFVLTVAVGLVNFLYHLVIFIDHKFF